MLLSRGSRSRLTIPGHGISRPTCRNLLTLAIETSCDDTCVAVLELAKDTSATRPKLSIRHHSKVTSNNLQYGGVEPLTALQSHQQNLAKAVAEALNHFPMIRPERQNLSPKLRLFLRGQLQARKPHFISVTRGPGMRSNLNTGLDLAKGLSLGLGIPLVAVHHMQAHALTPRLVSALHQKPGMPDLPVFPFLSLLVSGGHTLLIHSRGLTDHKILSSTIDIAVGDCLDKIARSLLPPDVLKFAETTSYGPVLEAFAYPSELRNVKVESLSKAIPSIDKKFSFTMPLVDNKTHAANYSFSGLVSTAQRMAKDAEKYLHLPLSEGNRRHLCRMAMDVAFEHLTSRVVLALQNLRDEAPAENISTIVVSGGVAANKQLRTVLRRHLDHHGYSNIETVFPPVELCTDNAIMIGWAGFEMFQKGWTSDLSCTAFKDWSLDSSAKDGGIVGVPGWIHKPQNPMAGAD